MRINGVYGMNQVQNKSKKVAKAYDSQTVASGKDTLALSDFAKELSVAKAAVSQTPDVRQAKVDDIKAQMQAGTYNVTANQVAQKIIDGLG